MGYGIALLIIGLAGLGGAALAFLVQIRVEVAFRRRHHDVGSTMYLQLGVVFAVLLAFVFSEVWSEYNGAAEAVALEQHSLHVITVLAGTLPPPEAEAILAAQIAYMESVIQKEWPSMARERNGDRETSARLDRLVRQTVTAKLGDPDAADTKYRILTALQNAQTDRGTRIFQASFGVPRQLWTLLIVFTLVLVIFTALSQIDDMVTAMLMTACFTLGLTSILVLVRLLDFPFEGPLALPSSEFQHILGEARTALEQVRAAQAGP
ncbi:bestrophin-like domain [Beijerinckia mobilis]|uniref:bestrophin-like domain n=1 Tax=Beijerinckia mobilis TaxID=231434 RepID=UPI0005551E29|nr:DUF4239 domain-containing protein [Beijerinckia mobilis]